MVALLAKSKKRKCVCGKNYVYGDDKYCLECQSVRDPVPLPSFEDIEKATSYKKTKSNQIIFAFKIRISKQKKSIILEDIQSWKDVGSVERVFDDVDSSSSSVELYVVYVKISSQTDSILNTLQSLSGIKYAYLSPGRKPK